MATPTLAGKRFSSSSPSSFTSAAIGLSWKRAWLPLLLLVLSMLTTAGSGARFMGNFLSGLPPLANDADFLPLVWIWRHPQAIGNGWSFSLTLLAILLAHEAGHFIWCRKHGVRASWPYVLPAPTLSGTMGAVIRIRSRIASRRALIEIGIAGPIAGFLVAVPAAIVGLLLSRPAPIHGSPGLVRFEQPLTITLLHHALTFLVPTLPSVPNLLPHPILMASWMGFFITSLNLIPAGQLDGGHILYALSPQAHRAMTFVVPAVLVAMGLTLWAGWLLWGLILLLPVMRHPRVPNFPSLQENYRWLGWLALALLVLTLLPAPFAGTGLLEVLK
jgi:Peptidase family M50